VIFLSRLDGQQIVVNADFIERIEARANTVITLVDGTTYVVAESPLEIITRVRMFKASVLVACSSLESSGQQRAALRLLPPTTLVAGATESC
jgi:flagellar protein FlbD